MAEDVTLIDRIYEAAFLPEEWQGTLAVLSERFDSRAGALGIMSDTDMRWVATERCAAAMSAIIGDGSLAGFLQNDLRLQRLTEMDHPGFVQANDILTPEELAADMFQGFLRGNGIEWQATTLVPLPSGAMAWFSFERPAERSHYDGAQLAQLDRLRPHLARAALMAARLGLERAQTTVSALAALGLPAAVLSDTGRVLTGNAMFEGLGHLFLPVAFGGLAIADPAANALFQETVAASRFSREPLVRSIPVRPGRGRDAAVVHVLPLRRAAHDIFSGADILVVATEISAGANVLSTNLLSGLFDLTPSEARLAAALASGKSLRQAAVEMGIGLGSARTYLARIFGKTGTNQQSQLVALLKSAQPMQS